MRQKISVVIITLNEERNIKRTLESVAWSDEIIIVDSGSSDKTISICREYTDSVFHQEWLGFAEQKNFAIGKATGDWVLSLDADEPVEPALADEIRSLISETNSCDGYRIPRRTFFLGKEIKHGGWYPDYNLRLFRTGKGCFEERAVHEAMRIQGRLGTTRHAILHYAYPDLASYVSSMNKYSTLAVEVMETKGIGFFRQSWMNIVFRPFFTFVHKYIFRFGFLDGKHGLILNIFHAYYVFTKYAKAWEHSNRRHIEG